MGHVKCFIGLVIGFSLYFYVNYLKRKQVIKNGMLTKEATSSSVVATSSALSENSLFSCVVALCLHSELYVDTWLYIIVLV